MAVKISNYVIGIVLFVLVITGGVAMLGMFKEVDSSFANDAVYSDFNETFNVYSDVSNSVANLEAGVTNSTPLFEKFGVINSLIGSAWNSLKLSVTSFKFMNSVFGGLTTIFGVPAWIPALIILIVSVIFVFNIFGLVFNRNP